MSEAANPNMQSSFPANLSNTEPSMPATGATEPPTDNTVADGWATINFPGALRVDEIPHSHASVNPLPTMSAADLARIVQQLRQENAHLKQQVGHLEQDLTQTQVELQLELARSLYQTPGEAATGDQGAMSQQVRQLAEELERSRQTNQGQQILLDTIQEQFNSSHERIAQLERECAALQQHYNEQVQIAMQSDSICRDLRKRLHRQQQQTLQLKAALEKCLEMPHLQGRMTMQDLQLPSPTAIEAIPLANPKAQPVKPWSTAPEPTQERFYTAFGDQSSGLPNSLADLLQGDGSGSTTELPPTSEISFSSPLPAPEPSEPLQGPSAQSPSNVLELIFPTSQSAPSVSPGVTVSPQESVFDLSPFLEAGEVPRSPDPIPNSGLSVPVATDPQTEEDVWTELNPFLDPANAAMNAVIPPSFNLSEPMMPPEAPAVAADRPVDWAISGDSVPADLIVEQEMIDPTMTPPPTLDEFGSAPANWPAPTLYPFRSPQKKRQSLAAVELPSFPPA